MCCNEPDIYGRDHAWWQDIHVGEAVVTFQSEESARAFLALGIDKVDEKKQHLYAALKFRLEQAEEQI